LNGGRLPETSNCYCHPGKAGGLPLCAKLRPGSRLARERGVQNDHPPLPVPELPLPVSFETATEVMKRSVQPQSLFEWACMADPYLILQ